MRLAITACAALLLVSCASRDANVSAGGNEGADGNAAAATGTGDTTGAAAAAFQPGQWETTTQITRMNMAGLPAGITPPMPPPTTVSYCMTPDQAGRPNAGFLIGKTEGGGCSYTDFSMSGGRLQGNIQCTQAGATTNITMNGQFSAESYEVTQQVQMNAGGVTTDMESRTTARRLGDCPAG
jgi:hypothetical protein